MSEKDKIRSEHEKNPPVQETAGLLLPMVWQKLPVGRFIDFDIEDNDWQFKHSTTVHNLTFGQNITCLLRICRGYVKQNMIIDNKVFNILKSSLFLSAC